MTTIAIVFVAVIAFAVGFGVGMYYTTKVIVEGKVKTIKYTG